MTSTKIQGTIKAQSLRRMAYNAGIYSHKDTVAQGWTLWAIWDDSVAVTAFDDFFALTDSEVIYDEVDLTRETAYYMSIGDLTVLEKSLRDDTGEYDLSLLPLSDPPGGVPAVIGAAESLCYPEALCDPTPLLSVALAPDRLRKLSLIKPGGYPIDCQVFDTATGPVVAFRCGPTVRGSMAPVDRDRLAEVYSGEEIWRSD